MLSMKPKSAGAAIAEAKIARVTRKLSFADTWLEIEKLAKVAAKDCLDGKSPQPKRMMYLIQLVNELKTGTKETCVLTFTVADIVKLTDLEASGLSDRISKWKIVSPKSGRRPATYDLAKSLATLQKQFRSLDDDDWNAFIIRAAGL
jgi:hypothetical protein